MRHFGLCEAGGCSQDLRHMGGNTFHHVLRMSTVCWMVPRPTSSDCIRFILHVNILSFVITRLVHLSLFTFTCLQLEIGTCLM